jgi:hypothetical protein
MGYTKIVQYGDITEMYEYEKSLPPYKPRYISPIAKKRARDIRALKKSKGDKSRTQRSMTRSRTNFFRLVHHNNIHADTVTFSTITFAHDITYKNATRSVSEFFKKFKIRYPEEISISYISVPELTANGRYHFHLLIYDLSPEISQRERKTRNLQRLFQRGYIDISPTTYITEGLAGYMGKYMAKALADEKNEAERGYTASRNIKKIYHAGSNSLAGYTNIILGDNPVPLLSTGYDVEFLGYCRKTVYNT